VPERRATDFSASTCFRVHCASRRLLSQFVELPVFETRSLADSSYNIRCPQALLSARFGQVDADLTFIDRIAVSLNESESFQPLQHWGEGIRLQKELSAKFADGLPILFPKEDHGDELGIGEAEILQQRLMDAIECVTRRVDCETQEFGKLQVNNEFVSAAGHRTSLYENYCYHHRP
jgi:hypothetical protein